LLTGPIAHHSIIAILQVWRVAEAPKNDKFQYTHFAHKINSFDTAPKKLLGSDSRLRPDRYALEHGDISKAGYEKSRYHLTLLCMHACVLNTRKIGLVHANSFAC